MRGKTLEVVLATRNPHKIRELKHLLADVPVSVLSLADFPDAPEPQENGETFAQNATIKAAASARATGRTALADDSGLEVDALDGRPGVYSSRFGGEDLSHPDKCRLVLRLMEGVPEERRTARFRAAVAITRPDGETFVVEGTCEGRIALEPKGSHGFGYDPIFYLPELGKTMAELPPEEKNKISHRSKAMQAAKEVLVRML